MSKEIAPMGDGQAEILKQFVENQTRELELRAKEMAVQEKQNEHNFEYAKKNLEAQERDRSHDRECARKSRADFYRLVGGVVLMIVILLGVMAGMGRGDIALEIVKAIVFLVSGGAGGYGLGRARTKAQEAVNGNGEQG